MASNLIPLMLAKRSSLLRRVYRVCAVASFVSGAAAVAGLSLLISADVVLRYFFNRPIVSAYELTQFMMVIAVFAAMSYTATERGHVRVELVINRLSKKTQQVLECVAYLLSAGILALIVQQTIVRANDLLFVDVIITTVLHVPVYPFYFLAAFGCAMLCFILLVNAVDSLTPTGKECE